MFYVITGLGWGVGSELVEAHENYERIQRHNFPHLTDEDLKEAWGFFWQVPDGTEGFVHGVDGLFWTTEDGPVKADPAQRVAYYGNVPSELQTLHEQVG